MMLAVVGGSAIRAEKVIPNEIVPSQSVNDYDGIHRSVDGRLLIIPTGTGVTLWDTGNGRQLRTFAGLDTLPNAVDISPDGRLVAAASDNRIIVWDTTTGSPLYRSTSPQQINGIEDIAFNASGSEIVFVGDPAICGTKRSCKNFFQNSVIAFWNFGRNQTRFIETPYLEKTTKVAPSRTGLVALATDSGNRIALFKPGGGLLWEQDELALDEGNGIGLEFSPDETRLAVVDSRGKVSLLDATRGAILASASPLGESAPASLSWAPDGANIAVWSNCWLRLLSATDLAEQWRKKIGEHTRYEDQYTRSILFIDNDRISIVRGGIRVISRADGSNIVTWAEKGLGPPVPAANQNAFGSSILASASNMMKWHLDDGRFNEISKGEYYPSSALPGGKDLFWAVRHEGGTAALVAVSGEAEIRERVIQAGSEGSGLMAAGGNLFAIGIKRGIRLFDIERGVAVAEITAPGDAENFYHLAMPESGTLVATETGNTVYVYTLPDGRLRSKLPKTDTLNELVFSKDGSQLLLIGTSLDHYEVQAWDISARPRKVQQFQLADELLVNSAEYAPDGKTIAVGSFDGVIRIWDKSSGRLVRSIKGHTGPVDIGGYSADGQRLVTTSNDGAKLWDVGNGTLIVTSFVDGKVGWLTITPEGFFNASEGAAANLSIVRGLEAGGIDRVYDALYRPDLVREKLAGDPRGLVKEAAAKLDLDKVIASGSPPHVRIISPQTGSDAAAGEITAEGEITDQGGGVGRVEWKVNGVTQGVSGGRGPEQAAPAAASTDGKITKLSQTLSLEPGENVIELTVYNAANLIASEPASVKVTLAETATTDAPTLYVLAIGINDYLDSRMQLNYSVPDAKQLSAALEKAGAGYYESVEALTLTDAQVTAQGLEQTFSELSRKISPRDVLVFYAAGHGKTMDGRYYYLPHDFRYQTEASIAQNGIGQEQWQAWFAKIPARKSILMYDTCESGTLTLPGEQKMAALTRSGLEQQAALGRLINATGRTVLTAATSDKPALEGYKGHGVFTYALLDGIARSDRNGNGLIEVTELAGFVDETVPQITDKAFGMRQFPQMSVQGSDFALVKKAEGLVEASEVAVPATIPLKPTHVVLELVKVFKQAGGSGDVVLELPPASTFAIVRTENGWSLIAKDGKELGYVEEAKATRLQ